MEPDLAGAELKSVLNRRELVCHRTERGEGRRVACHRFAGKAVLKGAVKGAKFAERDVVAARSIVENWSWN
ncbi:hypothetical protein RCO28_15070 [Streptomyces sp. LHD-70]|uniref:hypothetical protein n=1 Tax=Streptomyces sp. LHD-70 TaxID=3072140 RepID=UPI00280CAD1A|nr:hypothetical protein [Streptomyces sp. LHD-70]MDQ8703802.1 hypothetical protein [Streptomyces sp. LHD-70]